jgi:hypothetical protein
MSYIGNSFSEQTVTPSTDFFNGNGVTTAFTLSKIVLSPFSILVVVNNVIQNPIISYSINTSNQLVFPSPPSVGVNNIYVTYNSFTGVAVGIGQGSVPSSALQGPNAPSWDVNGNLNVVGNLVNVVTENIQTGSYTPVLSDQGRVVAMNNTSAATVTIPPESSVAFPIGAILYICRVSSGAVTLAGGVGVTLSKTGTFGASEQITLRKRSSNNWIVIDATTEIASASGGSTTLSGNFRTHSFTGAGSAGTFTVG